MAFVIDSRSKDKELVCKSIELLKEKYNATLLFIEASENTLVKRYKETRRKHPHGGDIVDAIRNEVELLSDVKDMADVVFNSDNQSVHELANNVRDYFKDIATNNLYVTIQSFGFKYGTPVDADIMFDARFLRNPFFVDELKDKTGLDDKVNEYVKSDENFDVFANKVIDMLQFLLPLYEEENKKYLNIAIGCTGGKHRSVTVVEYIAHILKERTKIFIRTKHRDIEK